MGKFINVIAIDKTVTRNKPIGESGKAFTVELLNSYSKVFEVAYESSVEAAHEKQRMIEEDYKNLPENAKNKRFEMGKGGDGYIEYSIGEKNYFIRYILLPDIYLKEKELA